MRSLAERARQRIIAWMAANPQITQETIAEGVGVSQTWVSQYKTGDQDADIDQLDALARVYGHTIQELIDLRPDPKEQALLNAFRKIRVEVRDLPVKMLEAMEPPAPPRAKARGRTGER